jgi:hypothetical protein
MSLAKKAQRDEEKKQTGMSHYSSPLKWPFLQVLEPGLEDRGYLNFLVKVPFSGW